MLKIAPCKFSGTNLNDYSNICIAGHNYNNNMFFSKISNLNSNDIIYLYSNTNIKYTYKIYSIFEIDTSDISSITNKEPNKKILTLLTCNNINNKRIIVQAKQIKTHQ